MILQYGVELIDEFNQQAEANEFSEYLKAHQVSPTVSLPWLYGNKRDSELYKRLLRYYGIDEQQAYTEAFRFKLRDAHIIWAKKGSYLHLLDRGQLYKIDCTYTTLDMMSLTKVSTPSLELSLGIFAYAGGGFDSYDFSGNHDVLTIYLKGFPPHWEHLLKTYGESHMTVIDAINPKSAYQKQCKALRFTIDPKRETFEAVMYNCIKTYARGMRDIYPSETKREISAIASSTAVVTR